jgi:hypothetical protein
VTPVTTTAAAERRWDARCDALARYRPDPEPAEVEQETVDCVDCDQKGIPVEETIAVRGKRFCRRDALSELAQVIAPVLDDQYSPPAAELDRIERAVPDLEELLYEVGQCITYHRAAQDRAQARIAAEIRRTA